MASHPDEVKAFAWKYLSIPVNIINSTTVIKIKNEGMPYTETVIVDDPENIENEGKKVIEINKCGDLHLKFNIKFPEDLSFEKREKIVKILKNEDQE